MLRRCVLGWLVVLPLIPSCQCDEEEPIAIPFGSLQGRACNPLTGQPEDGTVVKSTYIDPNTKAEATSSVEAEIGTGDFLIKLPAGVQVFSIENGDKFKKSYDGIDIAATGVTEWSNTDCREIAPDPGTGEIIGQICNRHTGSFVTDAEITVLLADGSDPIVANTDPSGNFIMEGVPAGQHIVYVRATGFQKTYNVTVIEGEQVELEPQTRDCAPPDPSTTAKIIGTICAQDPANPTATTGEPLSGVRVFVVQDEDGFFFEDETIEDGSFDISGIPILLNSGVVQVRAEKGAFSYTWNDVELRAQNSVAGPISLTLEDGCQPLQPDGGAKYLVVNGIYDKIQNTLTRMNLPNVEIIEGNPLVGEHWATNAFGDYEQMNQYDAIFVNCGADQIDFQDSIDPAVKANLRQYVQQGGSLYVSDWAYDLVEKVWPEKIDFYGDDTMADSAEFGAQGTYDADVVAFDLQECLGDDLVTIDYSFRGSALVKQIVSDATIYLRADMGYEVNGGVDTMLDMPITVGFKDGPTSGNVVFTSFHLESNPDGTVEVLDGPEDKVLRCLVTTL
jgi:hypothetical protein